MKLLICGKGGCGKSTVAALLAKAMSSRGKKVFLIDADESNIGLYRMLGLEMPRPLMDSLGGKKGFREKTGIPGTGPGSPGLFPDRMTMDDLPRDCVASSGGIRVMSVGKIRHFGEGCACPMGNLFRLIFASLTLASNDLVIVDTAAGVEHFGRSLDGLCDSLLCVVDPTYESIMMARRIDSLAREAGLPVSVLLNRLIPEIGTELSGAMDNMSIIGFLPENRSIFLNNLKGSPLDPDMPEMESVCNRLLKEYCQHDHPRRNHIGVVPIRI